MTSLGKPLIFYLKYVAEMDLLYADHDEGDEPDLTGLEDLDRVREMAHHVGDAASAQAADFLEKCAKGIEDHFIGLRIATFASQKKRAYLVYNWRWDAKVRVSSVPGGEFECGVSFPVEGNIIAWVWRKGGRSWAELVMKTLGDRAHARGGSGIMHDSHSGSVALACIPILEKNQEGFDVDRDALVEKVVGAFAALRADDVVTMARGVVGEDASLETEGPDELAE